jgi:hypothetical protein
MIDSGYPPLLPPDVRVYSVNEPAIQTLSANPTKRRILVVSEQGVPNGQPPTLKHLNARDAVGVFPFNDLACLASG